MKVFSLFLVILYTLSNLDMNNSNAQSTPTVIEVNDFLSNNHFLVTYREGEVLYGTYYFIEIHYCPEGTYGLYGKSLKKTVLGNEQPGNWQEFGTWKVLEYNGSVGVHYKTTTFQEKFVPFYRFADGRLSIGAEITIVRKGQAICK